MEQFRGNFEARVAALARLSETADNLTRPSFTESMRQANALMGAWMRAAGLTVRQDAMSNLIGRYEGTGHQTLLIGSHLDTVRDAGHYDGTLGVLLGLACVEQLAREGRRLPFAIEVIAFCDEEGLRFRLPYLGSKAFAGLLTVDDLRFADEQGVTLAQAMQMQGFDPARLSEARRLGDDLIGYLEAHIEQGPLLEAMGLPVGIVSAIAGQSRIEAVFSGEAGHAGTVPMHLRRDALVAAAKFITAVQGIGRSTEGLVATVGQIDAKPGASNAIPGKVTLSLDVRHQNDAVRHEAMERLHEAAHEIGTLDRVELRWEMIADNTAIPCDSGLIALMGAAAERLHLAPALLTSGAGHDAVILSTLTRVGMLFVRCKGGLSHHPAEFADSADAETAARVLLETINLLAQRPV